jgi:hypothetical protein
MVLFPGTTNENAGVIKAAAYPYSRRPAPPKDLLLVSLWGYLTKRNATS